MVDHPDLPQAYSSSQRQQQHSQQPHHHHHHRQQQQHAQPPTHQHKQQQPLHHSSQTHRVYQHHSQDIQGPLSAGVIEGHRAFASFRGSLHHHPRQTSSSLTTSSSSYPNLSVADILDRYQDAHKDFLVSILNAKAKEDERKAEEERYKTEQIKLQSKQLELELALERRRGSPPAGMYTRRSLTTNNDAAPYHTNYRTGLRSGSSSALDASRPHYGRHTHHDHSNAHSAQDLQEQPSSQHSGAHSSYQEQTQPQTQGRPPSLKINTAVRQSYPKHPQPHSSSSTSMQGPPPPGPNSSKGSGRHYAMSFSASAQSSPITAMDYQSHIPPPLTPKDDHISPTSALSPGPGQNLKRKSTHHDAIMDAVRAKVLRNAGQNQQQREQQHPFKKVGADSVTRRRTHPFNTSPERSKRAVDAIASSKSKHGHPDNGSVSAAITSDVKMDRPSPTSRPSSSSPISPSTPTSTREETSNMGSGRSSSGSPASQKPAVESHSLVKLERTDDRNGRPKSPLREDVRPDTNASSEQERARKYELDHVRAERSSGVVLAN
ncbi:hypothetical protein BG011_009974 [Mortierella polycephala]|uniref:Uncharacterized protein n=1 Tax=Mortierella polycephala TaxID=41804 RepID=A0A9P6TVR7_9FUNG|nr:hypothetical protein BG011_009974 [Mortierella polycephala]